MIFEFRFESPTDKPVTEWIYTEFEGEELTDTWGCIKVFSVLNDNITLENSYKTDS